jgi:hypothetical protein
MAISIETRVEDAAVLVNATGGDRLVYTITVEGPDPVFALVDSKTNQVLLSNNDTATNGDTFQRRWPRPADPVSAMSSHTMGLTFLDRIKYTYVVELHKANGTVRRVIDIDYSSENSEPAHFQRLGVTTF